MRSGDWKRQFYYFMGYQDTARAPGSRKYIYTRDRRRERKRKANTQHYNKKKTTKNHTKATNT